jgi:8-oxo-dGTP pyrophosphatase MutT (NUDIX family)
VTAMRINEREDGKIVVLDDDGRTKAVFASGTRRQRLRAAALYLHPELAIDVTPDTDPITNYPPVPPIELDGLNKRQMALRHAYEDLLKTFGQWNPTAGADGAAYVAAEANTSAGAGLQCANCTFWRYDPDSNQVTAAVAGEARGCAGVLSGNNYGVTVPDPKAGVGPTPTTTPTLLPDGTPAAPLTPPVNGAGTVPPPAYNDQAPAAGEVVLLDPPDPLKPRPNTTEPFSPADALRPDGMPNPIFDPKDQDAWPMAPGKLPKDPSAIPAQSAADAAPVTGFCDLVMGDIEAGGLCKFWVIPADKVRETAAAPEILAAGIALQATSTGRVLMLQRRLDPTDPNSGVWEFPGGRLEPGETPLAAAVREWQEEVGVTLPDGVTPRASWLSGAYQGFVVDVADEDAVAINTPAADRDIDDPDGDFAETAAWWNPEDLKGLGALRPELAASTGVWLPLIDPDDEGDGGGDADGDPDDCGCGGGGCTCAAIRPDIPVTPPDALAPVNPVADPDASSAPMGDVQEGPILDDPYGIRSSQVPANASLHIRDRREEARSVATPGPNTANRAHSFMTEVAGKTILTTRAQMGLGYWPNHPDGGGRHTAWLQARYVGGEVPNRNGALWKTEDLQSGLPTVVNGPLNWLHEERRIIGSLVDARFVPGGGRPVDTDPYAGGVSGGDRPAPLKPGAAPPVIPAALQTAAETDDPHIAVLAGVWRWVYPREAFAMEQAQDAGSLFVSMECIADEVQCAGDNGCGQSFPYERFIAGQSCSHLKQRGSVKRMVKPTFLGAGVIVPPARPGWADADARMMAVDLAQDTYAQAGSPDMPASQWEILMGQIVRFATL